MSNPALEKKRQYMKKMRNFTIIKKDREDLYEQALNWLLGFIIYVFFYLFLHLSTKLSIQSSFDLKLNINIASTSFLPVSQRPSWPFPQLALFLRRGNLFALLFLYSFSIPWYGVDVVVVVLKFELRLEVVLLVLLKRILALISQWVRPCVAFNYIIKLKTYIF